MSLAVQLAEKYSFEEFKQKMLDAGWLIKDFSDKPEPEKSYRSWYYKIRNKHEISHAWLIGHPNVWFYRKKGG